MIKRSIYRLTIVFVCTQLLSFHVTVFGQDSGPKVINTETFLVILETAMKDACDKPDSPFACASKDLARCRIALEITTRQCLGKLRNSLPKEFDLNNNEQAKMIFARCTMDNFIPAMGAENIDMKKCKKQAD